MIQTINLGQAANDGTGEPLRQGGQKINANFAELDTRVTAAQARADAAQPKEAGKGLSTNDYSNSEKDKVAAAIPSSQKGTAGGVATLGADGKLPVSQLPPLAVNEVFTVANQAAMLALTAERGDAAIRTDQNGQWYVLTTDVPTVLGNWRPINQNLGVALTALGSLTPAPDTIAYFNGTASAALTAFTAKARALLGRTTTAEMQTELGLGTAASANLTTTQFGGSSGQAMKVADFGLGAAGMAWAADATAFATSRFFSYGLTTTANLPAGADYGEGIVLAGQNGNEANVLFMNHDTDRAFGRRKRASGWQTPYEFHTTANSQLDPSQGTGGLMSVTTVSGFQVFKYVNGQMIVQGPIPTTASVAANTQFTVSVAIPVSFPVGYVTLLATLYPSVGNDFAIRNTQAPGSTAFIFCANGASAQTFSGNLTLIGRWK